MRSLVAAALLVAFPGVIIAQSPSAATPAIPACTSVAEPPGVSARASVASAPFPATELIVFGAASLRGAFESFVPALVAATGIMPLYSFDASSALRAQIEQAAPADVFAAADTANVTALLEAGLATDPVAFACNQLTVIVPAGNPAGITSATDLGRPGVKVIAAGDEVPITRYATQLAEDLGIADAYAANVASREDNVAAVRSRIELGEGDAGIVYLTDAIASGELVVQVAVPPEANVPATYAAAIVAGTDQPAEASAFLGWLTGPEAQGVLASFGFLPAP
jgi:molybdate transport system substrate-binding protein